MRNQQDSDAARMVNGFEESPLPPISDLRTEPVPPPPRSLKVLHLSTFDVKGGAARAAYRLHRGLRNAGHESSMLVLQRKSQDVHVATFKPPTDPLSRLQRRLRQWRIQHAFGRYEDARPKGLPLFHDDRSPYGRSLIDQLPPCDVINLHWISRFVDIGAFFARLPRHIPVVWTLHDMNAFTGGCHYSGGCEKFTVRCGACPQLGSDEADDLSRQVWAHKQAIFEQVDLDRLRVVTPSQWLADEARRSSLFKRFTVSVIPYGIDLDDFAPRDRLFARNVLGVPEDAHVILFAAESVSIRRKGFALLDEALCTLDGQSNLFLLSLGGGKPVLRANTPHLHLGYISDDRILSLVYSAADGYVISSLEDNLPNSVMEALACGTPVVGFDVGGIADMVRPGETGFLVPQADVRALGQAITELVKDRALQREMAVHSRRVALEEYALNVQAQRYTCLYEEMLSKVVR